MTSAGSAATGGDSRTWKVLIRDLSHGDGSEDFVLSGFPTFELARDYARRRTRASLEEARKPGATPGQIKSQWQGFGELVTVLDEPGYSPAAEIDEFIKRPASAEDIDHLTIRQQLDGALQMISFDRDDD
jgi:hypothetical protein